MVRMRPQQSAVLSLQLSLQVPVLVLLVSTLSVALLGIGWPVKPQHYRGFVNFQQRTVW